LLADVSAELLEKADGSDEMLDTHHPLNLD